MGTGDDRSRGWPATVPELLVLSAATLAVVVAGRVAVGVVVADPVHPVTYLGVVGGVAGALATVPAFRSIGGGRLPTTALCEGLFADPVLGDADRIRALQGLSVHVAAGAVLGGFYPHLFRKFGVGDRLVFAAVSPRLAVGVDRFRLFGDPGVGGGVFAALPTSLATAVLFTLPPFLASVALLARYDDRSLSASSLGLLYAAWVLYGLVLGAFVGLMQPVVGPALGV